MEIYQLKTFVAVATEGNLTRAAERVFTSPPAVSAQLKAWEPARQRAGHALCRAGSRRTSSVCGCSTAAPAA